ncbi:MULTISPECIES: CFI-box-CTERM domain-containing protein [unclassified Clostridioides]|uniref:CFI-box-CTERM domain-containing protein n=1 Tax=unclassified Clostridioides TaxID=2635829 RepID=UPI001D12DE64|nr:hypothetical protein [Clostridioides sp. ZZV15-6597]MCC0669220.1 hypothetical protein [Clostridioides sp. ZZV14-6153]MCC0726392.1 hypothetical protein [Clostridioides sp. ZZV14-6045]MCC0731251.1 hypothetical protein [Clostridioides sp. ZZV14-6048]MCC0735317.1 hypothetical protein [Clostridioides sp. ZZV14-6009]MCC0739946.1 hypothetical protein [Clostridioides sp. ZZV14-5902]
MGQKEVKCPKCKESIMVDNSKEVCFCINCGERIDLKSINLKKSSPDFDMYKSDKYRKLAKLAKLEYDAGNCCQAYDYYCTILESNPDDYNALFFKAVSEIRYCDLEDLNIDVCLNYIEKAWDLFVKFNPNTEKLFRQKRIMTTELYNVAIERFNYAQRYFFTDQTSEDHIYLYWNNLEECKKMFSYNANFLQDYRIGEDEGLRNIYLDSAKSLIKCIIEYYEIRKCVKGFNYDKNQEIVEYIKVQTKTRSELSTLYNETVSDIKKYEPDYEAPGINTGCYIATAVYGSYDAPEVLALRYFRDNTLANHLLGRLFIKMYYTLSPPVANWLKDAKKVNLLVKNILDKFVHRLSNK